MVNRGKLRGKSTNLEVVLFFRIRMCLLLCLFVAVSIFQCSISDFLELWPQLVLIWDGTGPETGLETVTRVLICNGFGRSIIFCPRTKPWLYFDLCFIFDLLTQRSTLKIVIFGAGQSAESICTPGVTERINFYFRANFYFQKMLLKWWLFFEIWEVK